MAVRVLRLDGCVDCRCGVWWVGVPGQVGWRAGLGRLARRVR